MNWPGVWGPSWSPDGTRIAFSDWQSGTPNIFIADLTGDEPVRRVTKSELFQWAYGWTNDGETLLFEECRGLISSCDIGLLPIDPPGEATMIVSGVASEGRPALSPDNEHLAYISDASGFQRIVIRSFPISGRDRFEVPIDDCDSVKWSPKGDELFGFCNGRLMAIPFRHDPVLSVGHPEALFSVDSSVVRSSNKARFYDVSADGERFLMVETERERGATLVVILNWLDEVERLVPTE
ncbi:MAG: PD40 domain-containing protein [Proteobacteria bacterium]|nr:PD40 domain-containing protein [Pseudomonadota bacterium]